jgi:uracil-DNA glycosylase
MTTKRIYIDLVRTNARVIVFDITSIERVLLHSIITRSNPGEISIQPGTRSFEEYQTYPKDTEREECAISAPDQDSFSKCLDSLLETVSTSISVRSKKTIVFTWALSIYSDMIAEFASNHTDLSIYLAVEPTYRSYTLERYVKFSIPDKWKDFFDDENVTMAIELISDVLSTSTVKIYPPLPLVFTIFYKLSISQIRVIIIGQDVYHGENQACGIAFSTINTKPPPSLKNIYKEMMSEGYRVDMTDGNLMKWVDQGVFLINTSLTVEEHKPLSHSKYWLKTFTPALMTYLDRECEPAVIVMWGNEAKKFSKYFSDRHRKIHGVHPSPLSASGGFFGSKPFSTINTHLREMGKDEIDWNLV